MALIERHALEELAAYDGTGGGGFGFEERRGGRHLHRFGDRAKLHNASYQYRGFGGLVTFTIRDADWRATADVVDRVQIPRIAPSLGGVESLIEQPMVMSYFDYAPEERAAFGIPDNMIRLSCGIENTEDLIEDLQQALEG